MEVRERFGQGTCCRKGYCGSVSPPVCKSFYINFYCERLVKNAFTLIQNFVIILSLSIYLIKGGFMGINVEDYIIEDLVEVMVY